MPAPSPMNEPSACRIPAMPGQVPAGRAGTHRQAGRQGLPREQGIAGGHSGAADDHLPANAAAARSSIFAAQWRRAGRAVPAVPAAPAVPMHGRGASGADPKVRRARSHPGGSRNERRLRHRRRYLPHRHLHRTVRQTLQARLSGTGRGRPPSCRGWARCHRYLRRRRARRCRRVHSPRPPAPRAGAGPPRHPPAVSTLHRRWRRRWSPQR